MELGSSRIIIRVDAGHQVGMGHAVRCLALASELDEQYDCQVIFLTKEIGGIADLIQGRGFKVKLLPFNVNKQEEIGYFLNLTTDYNADRIILDMKGEIGKDYILALRESGIPIVSIDNNSEGAQLADINIFPVAHFVENEGWKDYKGKLFYGAEYVILSRDFQVNHPHLKGEVLNVLVTMGGSDPNNLSVKVLNALSRINDITITIVLGCYFSVGEQIREIACRNQNIVVHDKVTNMAELMCQADIALTSFGVTIYELAGVGVPAITITRSREDSRDAELFARCGTCLNLGYYENVSDDDIVTCVKALLRDDELRQIMASKGKSLVDGKGASRVAEIIMS